MQVLLPALFAETGAGSHEIAFWPSPGGSNGPGEFFAVMEKPPADRDPLGSMIEEAEGGLSAVLRDEAVVEEALAPGPDAPYGSFLFSDSAKFDIRQRAQEAASTRTEIRAPFVPSPDTVARPTIPSSALPDDALTSVRETPILTRQVVRKTDKSERVQVDRDVAPTALVGPDNRRLSSPETSRHLRPTAPVAAVPQSLIRMPIERLTNPVVVALAPDPVIDPDGKTLRPGLPEKPISVPSPSVLTPPVVQQATGQVTQSDPVSTATTSQSGVPRENRSDLGVVAGSSVLTPATSEPAPIRVSEERARQPSLLVRPDRGESLPQTFAGPPEQPRKPNTVRTPTVTVGHATEAVSSLAPRAEVEHIVPIGPPESEELVRTQSVDRARPEPVMARSIVGQVIQSVSRATGDGVLEVRLQPEELGRVRLAMTTTEVGLTVHVTVERADTLDLIRRNIDMFQSDLRSRGFEQFNFSFAGEGSDRDFDPGQRGRPPAVSATAWNTDPDLTVEPGSHLVVLGTDRLDIRV